MRKITSTLVLLFGIGCTTLIAQVPEGRKFDPEKMKQRELQRLKESDLNLTAAQADSVIAVNLESRQQMRGFRDMTDDQRSAKIKEINEYRTQRWAAALKDEALAKKVAAFYGQRTSRRSDNERPAAEE